MTVFDEPAEVGGWDNVVPVTHSPSSNPTFGWVRFLAEDKKGLCSECHAPIVSIGFIENLPWNLPAILVGFFSCVSLYYLQLQTS